jgi:uncharacterized membrane protein YfcA
MKYGKLLRLGMIAAVVAVACITVTSLVDAATLQQAIENTPKGVGKGMIDPAAQPGWLGIPGAPKTVLIYGLLWAIWVGWIFSSVGAFGGIMAGVGHITIFGLGDYAKSFKKTNPGLNKLLTDSIRVSNQFLVGLSALISVTNYYRMGRLVLPLGICLAIGSISGSFLIPVITAGKVNFSQYVGYFGVCVFVIGGFLFYETTERGQRSKKAAKAAAQAFEKAHIKKKEAPKETEATPVGAGGVALAGANPGEVGVLTIGSNPGSAAATAVANEGAQGVHVKEWSFSRVTFSFYGVEFSFNPIIPVIGGFLIAALASFLGVGGGFLFVPFLTSIAGLPMFLVAGTSALAVLIGMIVSIFSYIFIKGVVVYWPLIGVELVGIFIGSMLGPRTSKYIPDIWLKRIFVVMALYVGLRYTTKGFLGYSIVPPF